MPSFEVIDAGLHAVPSRDLPGPGLRILVLAPYGSDASLTAAILQEAGMSAGICADACQLSTLASAGCGAWLVSEEALDTPSVVVLRRWLDAQPSWSDVPVVLVTRAGEISSAQRQRLSALSKMGSVTLLERPFRASTLVSALEMALRSRERQYQVRRLLEQTERDSEALREAARRKDEFLAMLAHELRNPLSSIAHAVTLQREAPAGAHQEWAAEVIERQTAQLTRLVDDLLDVSRITQGKIRLLLEIVDAAQVLSSACQTVRGLIESRDHTLHVNYPHGQLWLNADATRVEQIVVNLLTNAAKYTSSPGHVWLDASLQDGQIVISVRDSGIGIPPASIACMFDMFTQGDRTAARPEGGLGIGLPVVKTLCELHGGSVTAESGGNGQGSTFTVRLPAVAAPSSTATPVAKAPMAAAQSVRILVVDDNIDSAGGLERLLRRRGYTVDVAHDGPAALEHAHASPPAAVLLDIGLPGMNGYEVARRLRTMGGCAHACLVALTGYGQEEDRARSHASGFDAHFVKPVDFSALLRLLHERTRPPAQS